MTPRLTVHIGAIKTGSSAIQEFLRDNREELHRAGIVIPDEHLTLTEVVTGGQVRYFDERQHLTMSEGGHELAARIDSLLGPEDARQVIVSAENLSEGDNATEATEWFTDVVDKYNTKVIVYLRRQDEVLLSAWRQWEAKIEPDLWSWLLRRIGALGNWQILLERWERVVGRDRLCVRLYEAGRLVSGDVVADFERVVGTEDITLVRNPGSVVNPSFAESVVDLIPGGGFFEGVNDYEFYNFISETLGDAYYRRRGESAITFEQRLAILERYAPSNAWVRETYFGGTNVPDNLFEMPRPGDYTVRSLDELRREQIQLVARLVFEVGRRYPR